MIALVLSCVLLASVSGAQGFPNPGPGIQVGATADVTAPAVPTALSLFPGGTILTLSWNNGSRGLDRCDTAGCSVQWCVDGNVLAGSNLNFRARIKFRDNGDVAIATSTRTITYDGGPTAGDVFGGDWWNSGNVLPLSKWIRRGFFTVGAWDTDTDQWIPDSCEVAGTC